MPRPREEKTEAILDALRAFIDEGKQPTMREVAFRSLVGLGPAKHCLAGLVRAGHIDVKGYRRVHYRNKPVAEYGFPEESGDAVPALALTQALNTWR